MKILLGFVFALTLTSFLNYERLLLAEELAEPTDSRKLLATALQTNAQLAAANKELATRMQALGEQLAAMQTTLRTLRADRDEKLQRVVVLTDELHKMQDLVRRLEERQKELVSQINRLESAAADEGPVIDHAIVLAVRKNFLEISVGADDGVKVGHHLDVFRERSFIARVVVRRVDDDRAVAEVIPELKKGEVKEGDKLAPRRREGDQP